MTESSGGTPPGWYADSQGTQRWWDGSAWTEQTRADGPPDPPAEPAAPAAPMAPSDPTRVRQRPLLGEDGQALDPSGAQAPGQPAAYPPPQGGQFQPGAPGAPGMPPGQPAWAGMPMTPMPPTQSGPGGASKNRTVLFAAIGGGVFLLIVIVIVLILTLGGGDDDSSGGSGASEGGGDTGAAAAAEAFAEAVGDQDLEAACELTTSAAREEALAQSDADDCSDLTTEDIGGQDLADLTEDIDVTTEVGDVVEDGDTATADITVTSTYTGDDPDLAEGFDGVPPTNLTLELVKEDGDWLISDAS